MEVSSHALELRRVEDCEFDLGIFMNLTQDHLDFHGTMEDYYASKKRFFTDLLAGEKKGRRQGRIINIDDPWGRRLAEELGAKGLTTFGIDSIAFVQAKEVELSLDEIRAEIETPAGAFPLRAAFSGRFNLSNILAATAAAFHLGSRSRRSSGESRPQSPSPAGSRRSASPASPPSSSITPTRRTP